MKSPQSLEKKIEDYQNAIVCVERGIKHKTEKLEALKEGLIKLQYRKHKEDMKNQAIEIKVIQKCSDAIKQNLPAVERYALFNELLKVPDFCRGTVYRDRIKSGISVKLADALVDKVVEFYAKKLCDKVRLVPAHNHYPDYERYIFFIPHKPGTKWHDIEAYKEKQKKVYEAWKRRVVRDNKKKGYETIWTPEVSPYTFTAHKIKVKK